MSQCKRFISGSDHGACGKNMSLTLGIIVFICVSLALANFVAVASASSAARQLPKGHLHPYETPDTSGRMHKTGGGVGTYEILRVGHWEVECQGRSSRGHDCCLICELDQEVRDSPLLPSSECVFCFSFHSQRLFQGHSLERVTWCLDLKST